MSLFSQAFAIFCGLGIHNALMYEQACKLLAKQSVAMEVYNYFQQNLTYGIIQPELGVCMELLVGNLILINYCQMSRSAILETIN